MLSPEGDLCAHIPIHDTRIPQESPREYLVPTAVPPHMVGCCSFLFSFPSRILSQEPFFACPRNLEKKVLKIVVERLGAIHGVSAPCAGGIHGRVPRPIICMYNGADWVGRHLCFRGGFQYKKFVQ